jgi:hypothetical protein
VYHRLKLTKKTQQDSWSETGILALRRKRGKTPEQRVRYLELWNFQVGALVQLIFYLSDSFKDPRRNVCRERFIDGIKLPGQNRSDTLDFDSVMRDLTSLTSKPAYYE